MRFLVRGRNIFSSQPLVFQYGNSSCLYGDSSRCSAVYARLIEFGTGIPAKNPYVAEMYKLAPEGYPYSRSIP